MNKVVLSCLVSLVSLSSFAQVFEKSDVVLWEHVEVGYDRVHYNVPDGLSREFNFGGFGYHVGLNILPSLPSLIIETGLNFAFGTSHNTQYNILNKPLHVDYSNGFMKIPILASYQFPTNDNITIMPQFGFYFKTNLYASTNSYSSDPDVIDAYNYYGLKFGKQNLYKHSSEKFNWNRCAAGLQLGINAVVHENYLVGINYSYEFTKIDPFNNARLTSDVNVKIGYIF